MEGNSIRAEIIGGGGETFGAKTSLAVMRGWCLSIWASMVFRRNEVKFERHTVYNVTWFFRTIKKNYNPFKSVRYVQRVQGVDTKKTLRLIVNPPANDDCQMMH